MRPAIAGFFRWRFTDGMPVRANDFSQSWIDGPRMLPSMYARPGHRVQLDPCEHCEQPGRSRIVIERTSFISGECRQISRNFCRRTLPLGSGNCTQGYTSP